MTETKMGRPFDERNALDKMMSVRLSSSEYETIRLIAETEDLTVGKWVRATIRRQLQND
jgi:hypothetical protein